MESLLDFLLNFYGPTPYFLILGILLACGMGLPMPEDITLFAAGLLAYYGVVDLWWILAVAMFGVLFGDAMIFFLGRKFGRRLTKKWFFHKLLPDERLDYVGALLAKRGKGLIFAARFMPGLRTPIFFTAGTLHLPFRSFLLLDGGAALLSVPLIILLVFRFGDRIDDVIRMIQKVEHGIFIVILAIIAVIAVKWYMTKRRIHRASVRENGPVPGSSEP